MNTLNASDPYEVSIQYDVRIPVRDGLALSANLYMPVPRRPGEHFPAVLEMIPYRKDDWRAHTDHRQMSFLARHGYVGCRLDVRGTGSSPGIAFDEYTEAETLDGCDAVEWLARQQWCNGRVGMWGISYGGFTAIQVASRRPPSLKAIVPMYATDDRFTDDVHYLGGCLTCSELAQYAVSQIGMNALPPSPRFAGADWQAQWRHRLEMTPPWLLEWLRQQVDGPYWRNGSLAPAYDRILCAVFHIGGWADGYTNPVLRMLEQCVNAPRKALIGPWVHLFPDTAYPGPNVDWLAEMVRFFDHWLKGIENGIMDEPAVVYFRGEYTPPEPFPKSVNGAWCSDVSYPSPGTRLQVFHLGRQSLLPEPSTPEETDTYPHRPTLGTRSSLCWGAGAPPNGLARDLRPDEALGLTYTSSVLDAPLDVFGLPEAILYVSSSAPVAHVVVRLTDVAPDGTSALVSTGILNLTHRDGHAEPSPLVPGEVYEVRVGLKATGYRFLAGHRFRLSVASAYWPLIWPSPYPAQNGLYRGANQPSRLVLPVVSACGEGASPPPAPEFGTREDAGEGWEEPAVWQVVEDVVEGTVTVKVYEGDTIVLSPDSRLASSEMLEMTASDNDPARVRLYNEVKYRLLSDGHDIQVDSSGTIRSTETDLIADLRLEVCLDGKLFFSQPWLERIPRRFL